MSSPPTWFLKRATDLTAQARGQIKAKNFALPGRRYPVHDESHARAALSMVAAHGSGSEKAQVRAEVARKYPGIDQSTPPKEAAERETGKGWSVSNSREGRRPLRVDTLLRKEKDGTLGGHDVGAFKNPNRVPSRDDELPDNLSRRVVGPVTPEIKCAFVWTPGGRCKVALATGPGTFLQQVGDVGRSVARPALDFVHKHENPIEVAGLGYLAAPNVDNMQAKVRARRAGLGDQDGHVSNHDMDQFRVIPDKAHDVVEATGLGSLAAPLVAKRLRTGSWH